MQQLDIFLKKITLKKVRINRIEQIMKKNIYDGKTYCGNNGCSCGCPVVNHLPEEGMVEIYDPAKPENGKVKMTVVEFNTLISNATCVEVN